MPTAYASLLVNPVRWLDALPSWVPAQARRWICLQTSMTRAMQERFGTSMRVDVRFDGKGRLRMDESRLLGTRKLRGQVREVVLRIGERDLLAARTVHVSRRLASHAALASLGSRPLGELLFAAGRPRRLARQFARLRLRQATRSECWARRTVYVFERQRMLVTEAFLAGMVKSGRRGRW